MQEWEHCTALFIVTVAQNTGSVCYFCACHIKESQFYSVFARFVLT